MKDLTKTEIDKIVSFYERFKLSEEPEWLMAWFGICNAAASKFISFDDSELLFDLKYKYGKKVLRKIKSLEVREASQSDPQKD